MAYVPSMVMRLIVIIVYEWCLIFIGKLHKIHEIHFVVTNGSLYYVFKYQLSTSSYSLTSIQEIFYSSYLKKTNKSDYFKGYKFDALPFKHHSFCNCFTFFASFVLGSSSLKKLEESVTIIKFLVTTKCLITDSIFAFQDHIFCLPFYFEQNFAMWRCI